MADAKISQLPTGTAVFGNDILPYTHGITGSATPETQQLSFSRLRTGYLNDFYVTGSHLFLQGQFQPSGTHLYGSSVLASGKTITGTNGSYQEITGVSLTLPESGTYFVEADVRGALNGNTGALWFLVVKLYNSTDAADVANSDTMIVLTSTSGKDFQSTAGIGVPVTVTSSKVIKLYAKRDSDGTFTTSEISSDTNGKTRMRYVRII